MALGARRGLRTTSTGLALAAAAAACSSTHVQPPQAEGGTDASPPVCLASSACVQQPSAGQECVTTLSATVNDQTGAAVAGLPVFVCGTNLCSDPVNTDATGAVDIAVCLPFAAPAFKVFSDPTWGPFAAVLPPGGPSFDLGPVTVTALPSSGAALASGTGPVTSNGVTLALESTTVTFDVEHQTPDAQLFRAVQIAPGGLPSTLESQVTVAWALAPLNTKLSPAVELDLPNAAQWPGGSAVDVYLNGTDTTTSTPPAPWGSWGLLGTGSVSQDGTTVVLTAAQGGLPEIAMVGVVLHGDAGAP